MKKIVFFVLLILVGSVVEASTIPTNLPEYKVIIPSRTDKVRNISDSAKFYLVTCEPAKEIYERFGHSGIRVYDPETKIDEVFHWGLFSFDTPNFVGRFISGNTDYEMGVYSTKFFLPQYVERGSSVYAQELNLTTEQKHALWAKLWDNYRPENRKYRYNFIYDNCATRPYQMILDAYEGNVISSVDLGELTYRDIIDKYVAPNTLYNLGISLIVGSEADKNITTEECVSFPLYTQFVLDHTKIISTNENIVVNTEILHQAEFKPLHINTMAYNTFTIIATILILICIVFYMLKKRYMPVLTQLILIVSGLVGIIIAYLWFCSHHPLVSNNYNILWCNPLNLIFGILLFTRRTFMPKAKMIIAIALHLISILFLLVIIFDLQNINASVPMLWLMTAYALSTVAFTYKNQLKNSSRK